MCIILLIPWGFISGALALGVMELFGWGGDGLFLIVWAVIFCSPAALVGAGGFPTGDT